MNVKNVLILPAVLALSACMGSGDGSTTETYESTTETLSLSVPQASGEPAQYQTLTAALEALPTLNEGDVAQVPLSEIEQGAPEGVNFTLTVGQTFSNGTLITADIPAYEGNAGYSEVTAVSSLQGLANVAVTDPTNQTFPAFISDTVINGTRVTIGTSTADNDYSSLYSGTGTTDAEFATETLNGSSYNQVTAGRNGASFTNPSGSFGYSGEAALAVANEVAVGNVTMSADFDAGTASITAPSLTVDGSETTAGFNGSVAIDNTSGRYASSGATITVNEQNIDAGIIGIFSSDATTSSGSVFSANQNAAVGAAGVFSVVQDAQ